MPNTTNPVLVALFSNSLGELSGAIRLTTGTSTEAKPLPVEITIVKPEVINGVVVPPEPAVDLNNLTIAGFDANGNGIRDDVERLVARNFGSDVRMYSLAFRNAKTLQTALLNPTIAAIQENIDASLCIDSVRTLASLNDIEIATINTPIRKTTYGRVFAGAYISNEGC